MIGPEERRMLYFVAANRGNNDAIVDAGSYLGASTLSLAAGAAARGHRRKVVVAYDFFKAMDQYVVDAISKDFRPIEKGESYLDIFLSQTQSHSKYIDVRPGDFLQQKWDGGDISILFVDIAKTPALNAHVFAEFFPALRPGSFIIQQDYHHAWHPYMQICMELVDDYLELVDSRVHFQSRAWQLKTKIPPKLLARCQPGTLTEDEGCSLLDNVIAKSQTSEEAGMLMTTKLWYLVLARQHRAAASLVENIEKSFDTSSPDIWARQFSKVKELAIARNGEQ